MSNIHLNRDRVSLGQFSPEAIAEGLRSGRFRPTDLAWQEGMDAWKPLSEWSDLPTATPGRDWAQESKDADLLPVDMPAVPTIPESTAIQPAWESPEELSVFTRIFETVKGTLGNPAQTFSNLSKSPGIWRPFFFVLLLGTICNLVAVAYEMAFSLADPSRLTDQYESFPVEWMVPIYVGLMVLMPVLITVFAFIGAATYHLGLMLTGSAKEGFATTARVAFYVQGSTAIFQLVPVCGQFVQVIWALVALVIGLHKAHKVSVGASILAVLLPVLLFCGCFLAAIMLGFGAAFAGSAAAAGG